MRSCGGDALPAEGFYIGRGMFARHDLTETIDSIGWEQRKIKIYGREYDVPRLTAWYGSRAYTYSGIDHAARPAPAIVESIRREVSSVFADGSSFDSVLCNLYRHGGDSVSWHADDEPELGPEPVIASVSLGAPRMFSIKTRDGRDRWDLELRHGDLLVMRGRSQADYLHSLPKTGKLVGPRVNLTFRRLVK